MAKNYIIEHMEEGMHDWCKLEYEHMVSVCGPEHIYFTALTPKTLADMPETLAKAHCHTEDIMAMSDRIPHQRVCLLDPASPHVLSPGDAKEFDFFLFGGILGDDPPRDRTGELRKLGFATRHLGAVQMTTDTAVNVTRRIVEGQVSLDEIPFIDHPEIKLRKNETVTMPFRYIALSSTETSSIASSEGGSSKVNETEKKSRKPKLPQPLLPPGMLELLKKDNDMALDLL
ncbi:hypothetical protein BX616_002698 [Lobosporangium transversale]|uniref:SAM-dependent RNA methyltransferase n=1 Tax=Lobosporangium transversale TaxID=64571 RepID=A0A1Y2GLJ2_9FUNG|nr:hypothetical protein BCR41DRAFT_354169 [Lobosporangium transversale]KAF9919034.1 hypothetical protein BX616_002698 [Lobosporangium transversale]ORZ14825.1 hypothetical protein BCR41DRAFT_354169 [Lobosporangium transversale]|eukprot:XP_021880957.1 hypothetical protein BCR41DRAFT_354169 [Lobosporangium transversale]